MLDKKVSIIISLPSLDQHVIEPITKLMTLHPYEIIVVTDQLDNSDLNDRLNCLLIDSSGVDHPFHKMVLGANSAKGEILLFLDEYSIYATKYLPKHLSTISHQKVDIVTSLYPNNPQIIEHLRPIEVWARIYSIFHQFDRSMESMLRTPIAVKRSAINRIGGLSALANPVIAYKKLLTRGLRLENVRMVQADTPKKFDPAEHGRGYMELSKEENRVIKDYIEALHHDPKPFRNGFTDGSRQRWIAESIETINELTTVTHQGHQNHNKLYFNKNVSVIIPAQNEERTIRGVINQIKQIMPYEIIVIVNGSNDATAKIAIESDATTLVIDQALGVDVGRSIGAYKASGDILLFMDADFIIPAEEIYPFPLAICKGYDVALNDQSHHIELGIHSNEVALAKYALNIALKRLDLGASSMLTVPFAINRKALNKIGVSNLLCPPKAHAISLVSNLKVGLANRVDVDRLNRIRAHRHSKQYGLSIASQQIIGDHVEAMKYLSEYFPY